MHELRISPSQSVSAFYIFFSFVARRPFVYTRTHSSRQTPVLLDYTTSQTHLPPLTHVRFVLCCPAGLTLTDSHSCASVAPNPVPGCGAHTWLGGTHSHRLTQLRIRPPLSVSCRSQPGPEAHALGGTHSHTHSCTHPATSVARHSQPGPEAHALRFLPPHELELVDLELRRRGFHCRLSLSLSTAA